MKALKRFLQITWVTVCILVAVAVLLPEPGTALDTGGDKTGWFRTAEADARTAAGACGASKLCLEYCLDDVPTGFFQCFDR